MVLILLTGCGGDNSGTNPQAPQFPDSNLSFSQHIRPIFLNNCVDPGCHSVASRAGGLDLETNPPNFLSESGAVVIPGDPLSSILYLVLFDSFNNIRRMPPDRPLFESERTAIGTWIREGARTDSTISGEIRVNYGR